MSDLTARVYKYGMVPKRVAPICGAEAAHEQLRLANRLWNTLTAIDRRRVERYRAIMHDDAQERIESLKGAIAELREAVKAKRQSARAKVADPDLTAAISERRAELHALLDERKATAQARHEARRTELQALTERTKRRIKRARQAAASMGLFWGTYNDIVQRADIARKAGEPRFRRFTGDGTLTAQIMGGAVVADAFGAHTFFAILPPQPGQKWRYAAMRIGSNPDRSPVWLRIPIVYHRPLPPEATIKSVSMTKRHGRWSLNVTVTLPAAAPTARRHRIAMDLGYRRLVDGVRVGYLCDDTGKHGPITVRERDVMALLEHIPNLRSNASRMVEELAPALAAWIGACTLQGDWARMTTALHAWRSGRRFCRLIEWWRDNRLPGDEEIYSHAAKWRSGYLHLDRWANDLEDKVRARIRERYRIVAAQLARHYGVLYIEKLDLRELVRRPAPESDEPVTAARRYRQIVAPSEFRAALLNACKREGVRVVEVPAEHTTRRCHACGKACEWDQAAELIHVCEHCGSVWDQDHNAAINILRRGASGEAVTGVESGKRERKWDRVKRLSQEGSQDTEGNNIVDSSASRWDDYPSRLRSLLDMLQVLAQRFVWIGEQFSSDAARYQSTPDFLKGRLLEKEEVDSLVEKLQVTHQNCQGFGLDTTLNLLEQFRQECGGRPIALKDAQEWWTNIHRTFTAELNSRLMLLVLPHRAGYWSSGHAPNLYGYEIASLISALDGFPEARHDAVEAGNCFACERFTASVYHQMRVAEHGLIAVADSLNVDESKRRSWALLIGGIQSKLKAIESDSNKPSGWEEKRKNYNDLCSWFTAIQNGWRNPASHTPRVYEEHTPRGLFPAIRALFEHLKAYGIRGTTMPIEPIRLPGEGSAGDE